MALATTPAVHPATHSHNLVSHTLAGPWDEGCVRGMRSPPLWPLISLTVMEAPGRAPFTSIWLVMDGQPVLFLTASAEAPPCPVPSRWSCWLSSGWQSGLHLCDTTQLAQATDRGVDSYELWMNLSSSLVSSTCPSPWEHVCDTQDD